MCFGAGEDMSEDEDGDEYYPVYEYSDPSVMNNSISPEPGVIPVPVQEDNVMVISESTLTDTDLRDHDLIDSLVYIYYGKRQHHADSVFTVKTILMISAAVIVFAHIWGFIIIVNRIKKAAKFTATSMFIMSNLTVGLAMNNFLLMTALHTKQSGDWCRFMYICLHVTHLFNFCWLFDITAFKYCYVLEQKINIYIFRCAPWAIAFAACIICNLAYPFAFQSQTYCESSVVRGITFTFFMPIVIVVILNTLLVLWGLKITSSFESKQTLDNIPAIKRSFYVSAFILPCYMAAWFIGILALRHKSSIGLAFLSAVITAQVNWFICVGSYILLPTFMDVIPRVFTLEARRQLQHQPSTEMDSQPLLTMISTSHTDDFKRVVKLMPDLEETTLSKESEELSEIRVNSISTISTPAP